MKEECWVSSVRERNASAFPTFFSLFLKQESKNVVVAKGRVTSYVSPQKKWQSLEVTALQGFMHYNKSINIRLVTTCEGEKYTHSWASLGLRGASAGKHDVRYLECQGEFPIRLHLQHSENILGKTHGIVVVGMSLFY
jgi:hypothetical protein